MKALSLQIHNYSFVIVGRVELKLIACLVVFLFVFWPSTRYWWLSSSTVRWSSRRACWSPRLGLLHDQHSGASALYLQGGISLSRDYRALWYWGYSFFLWTLIEGNRILLEWRRSSVFRLWSYDLWQWDWPLSLWYLIVYPCDDCRIHQSQGLRLPLPLPLRYSLPLLSSLEVHPWWPHRSCYCIHLLVFWVL